VVLWHYAVHCDLTVGTFVRVLPAAGKGQRVGTVLNHVRRPFRANPLIHADMLLGIDTGNIIWNTIAGTRPSFNPARLGYSATADCREPHNPSYLQSGLW
jgi:hypothetical protein